MMFKGMYTAMATPFTVEGELDLSAAQKLADWLAGEGVDGIVVCGTTGEAPTMGDEEQFTLLELVIEAVRGRTQVIMGTGCYDTRATQDRTRRAKALGADAAMAIIPYYNRPTPEGCIAHFKEISKAGLPLICYHHPARTGVNLKAEELARIAEIPGVSAIKEGGGNIELLLDLVRQTDKPVLTGCDEILVPSIASGAQGVISVMGNLIPKQWTEITHLLLKGDMHGGRERFNQYADLCHSLFIEINPQPVKYALHLMGKCTPRLRLPLLEPRETTKKIIEKQMALVHDLSVVS